MLHVSTLQHQSGLVDISYDSSTVACLSTKAPSGRWQSIPSFYQALQPFLVAVEDSTSSSLPMKSALPSRGRWRTILACTSGACSSAQRGSHHLPNTIKDNAAQQQNRRVQSCCVHFVSSLRIHSIRSNATSGSFLLTAANHDEADCELRISHSVCCIGKGLTRNTTSAS